MPKPDHRGRSDSPRKGGPDRKQAGRHSDGEDDYRRESGKSRKPPAVKGPSQRMLRVGELIRHKLAEMLARHEVHDDVLGRTVITVPEVRLAPDLKFATVYVMPLGGKDIPGVLEALERHKKHIRSEIANAVNLKYAPDLKFRVDETFAEADRIGRIMSSPKVRQDLVPDPTSEAAEGKPKT
jgi:ribosome-binding factor A